MKGLVIHRDVVQGTQEWIDLRCGLLTASEMCRIVTPAKLQSASNEKERSHLYELAAQRITGRVDPSYQSDDMLRGEEDEYDMRDLYSQRYAPVEQVGFITNDKWGFTLGYSPDGLVGQDGLVEGKSRRQGIQVQTIVKAAIPTENVIQTQTGLLVSERKWCDYISYSAGLPMFVVRAIAVPEIQEAILEAARLFEAKLADVIDTYHANVAIGGFGPTDPRPERDIRI